MGKQKVVMRVAMEDAKKRSRALKTVVGLPGVLSVGLEGEDKDRIVVIGDEVDPVLLTTMLRKRMGHVELVSVAPVDQKKEEKKESKTDGEAKIVQPVIWPYQYEIREPNYDQCCCIM